jgi:hypothetical protein
MTLLALVVAVTSGAQGTSIHEFPWNPDWNNDNQIGSSDLTGFLSVFGSEFGSPPDQCNYEGTTLENLIIAGCYPDGFEGFVLDSIFMEYSFENTETYYLPGCPESVTDTIYYQNQIMMTEWISSGGGTSLLYGYPPNGIGYNRWQFTFDEEYGKYYIYFEENITSAMNLNSAFPGSPLGNPALDSELPIDTSQLWLDDSGLNFCCYADYVLEMVIIPYWHYAE